MLCLHLYFVLSERKITQITAWVLIRVWHVPLHPFLTRHVPSDTKTPLLSRSNQEKITLFRAPSLLMPYRQTLMSSEVRRDVELPSESSVYLFWHRQAIFLSYVLVLGWATPTRQTGSVYPFIPWEWGGVCPTTSSLDGEDSWITVSSGSPGGPRRSE